MAYKIVNRQMQIPNGYTYQQPETRWRPSRYSSFSAMVGQVCHHRKGNPKLLEKYSDDPAEVAEEMDIYNAELCVRNGWMKYVQWVEDWQPPPKLAARLQEEQAKLGVAAAKPGVFRTAVRAFTGAVTIADWLGSDGKSVEKELSESRAKICATCPQNQAGDLTSFFTKPVSDLIRRQLQEREGLKLSTLQDAHLGVCGACGCPLKLKVHVPLNFITQHMHEPEKANLDKRCWILSEKP